MVRFYHKPFLLLGSCSAKALGSDGAGAFVLAHHQQSALVAGDEIGGRQQETVVGIGRALDAEQGINAFRRSASDRFVSRPASCGRVRSAMAGCAGSSAFRQLDGAGEQSEAAVHPGAMNRARRSALHQQRRDQDVGIEDDPHGLRGGMAGAGPTDAPCTTSSIRLCSASGAVSALRALMSFTVR